MMWSAAATGGDRGLWLPAHGTGASFAIIRANTNNFVTILADDIWASKTRIYDNWIGFYNARQGGTRYGYVQADANRMYFRKENGASNNIGFDFGANIYCSGEYISGAGNGLRIKNMILRNDGSNVSFLIASNSNTPGDNWNGLRPFYFNLSNGNVTMGHNLQVNGLINNFELRVGNTGINANTVANSGLWIVPAAITNAATSNHGTLLYMKNVGTPC